MAVEQDVVVDESAPTYCTMSDVYRLLQAREPAERGDQGAYGQTDVDELILDIEDIVDEYTDQAWRERQVIRERPDLIRLRNHERYTMWGLTHAPVKAFDSAQGDKLEVFNGDEFEDYLLTQNEGRMEDFYVNRERGRLFIRPLHTRRFHHDVRDRDDLVRITYRYGHSTVPRSIKRATALLTAASTETGETISPQGFGTDLDRMSLSDRVAQWVREASQALQPHRSVI